MLGFRLAFSLLRIPRLFVSLLLFPLFLSVVLLVVQLLGSTILIRAVDSNPGQLKARLNALEDQSFLRQIIYGDPGKIKHLDVCRWQEVPMENGQLIEMPPSDTCKPDRLDVALHVAHPESYDSSHYEEILSGNFERLHICKSRCAPDVILNPEKNGGRADAYSIPTLLLLNRAFLDETVNNDFIKLANTRNKIMNLIGIQYLHAEGYDAPVQLTAVSLELAVLGSIASIIIVGLWLAIRAHRKVLDYFARSGALLPMVAALGKREFYAAIWLVTGLRVGAFLVASVPSTYFLFQKLGEQEDWRGIFQQDLGHFLLWLFALIMSFTFAAIVASIADLKHRHGYFSILYRYIPLILSIVGGVLWTGSFLLPSGAGAFRGLLTSLPILGIGPIILGPLFQPSFNVLALHTLLTASLIVLLVRSNARWFAAHLEEL